MLTSMIRPGVGFAALMLVGCHGPLPEGVYPCTVAETDCPAMWVCRADSRCWSTAPPLDGGVDGGVTHGGIDAYTSTDVGRDSPTPDTGWDANCPLITYYADCDGDHFAAPTPQMTYGCSMPTIAPDCVGGQWTTTEPTIGMTDCADRNALAFPRSDHFGSEAAWMTADGVRHYDYNCDGLDTPEITAHDLGPVSSCDFLQDPPPDTYYSICFSSWRASPDRNWVGAVPACGVSGELNTCPPEVGLPATECRSTVRSVPQACN